MYDFSTSTYTVQVSGLYDLGFDVNNLGTQLVQRIWYFDIQTLKWEVFGEGYGSTVAAPPTVKWYIVKNNTANNSINGTVLYSWYPNASIPTFVLPSDELNDSLYKRTLPPQLASIVLSSCEEIATQTAQILD